MKLYLLFFVGLAVNDVPLSLEWCHMIATQQLQRKGGATTRKEKICHQMGVAVYLFFEIYTQSMSRVRPQLADF